MSRTVPPEVDPAGFETKLSGCSQPLRDVVGYLRFTAQGAGVGTAMRRYNHPAPNSGWGISYYVAGERFCEIHPKAKEEHAWIYLAGVDPALLAADGFELSSQPGWFKIRNMFEAVRAVKWIISAFVSRTGL